MILHSQDSTRAMKIFETFCGSFGGGVGLLIGLGNLTVKSLVLVIGMNMQLQHGMKMPY